MTRQDFIYKWLFYGLALLPVWWLEVYVLNRFPVLGVAPTLLPVAAVTVAVPTPTACTTPLLLTVSTLLSSVR